jgi:hypothetical protein
MPNKLSIGFVLSFATNGVDIVAISTGYTGYDQIGFLNTTSCSNHSSLFECMQNEFFGSRIKYKYGFVNSLTYSSYYNRFYASCNSTVPLNPNSTIKASIWTTQNLNDWSKVYETPQNS